MLDHYVALLSQIGADAHIGALMLEAPASAPALASHAFMPVGERIAYDADSNAVHCEGACLSYDELLSHRRCISVACVRNRAWVCV
ncbi:pyoverdine siderophore biosynthesis non-ribosomal peptide synthetase module [Candidatus Burkholderia humilis]|nr:pyoverdine siderophore biosynthesis non-ribosomal peptide synthetase module [Candidatus Burkholderia humilis]